MSWAPNDLVTDADLTAYERDALSSFGVTTWQAKRTKALEDWLFPILKSRGFNPYQLRTRYDADQVWGYTSSAYTDLTAAASSATADDLALATIFATPGTDALYVGSTSPFRGLYWRVLDTPSSGSSVVTVSYWRGAWTAPTDLIDETVATTGKTLSQGGAMTWTLPPDWTVRAVNGSDPLYWAKVTVSAVPTSGLAGQLAPIRASVLRGPLAFRTLHLIMREAPTGQEGPWLEKAEFYKDEADESLQRALTLVGGEFDLDASEQVSATEATQTIEEAGGGGFSMERA